MKKFFIFWIVLIFSGFSWSINTDQTSKKKRTPVARACAGCRVKKLKCDGLLPCGPCQSKRRKCNYTTPAKRGRKAKNPNKYVRYGRHSFTLNPPVYQSQTDENNQNQPINGEEQQAAGSQENAQEYTFNCRNRTADQLDNNVDGHYYSPFPDSVFNYPPNMPGSLFHQRPGYGNWQDYSLDEICPNMEPNKKRRRGATKKKNKQEVIQGKNNQDQWESFSLENYFQ